MRIRRIAILIDGGFFLRRLPKLLDKQFHTTPAQVAESARHLCKRHVQRLSHLDPKQGEEGWWLDHVYRLFFYDASPYEGASHHPILNRRIEFARSDVANFRRELFNELRHKRKFALRLGHVTKENEWQIAPHFTKPLLNTWTASYPSFRNLTPMGGKSLPPESAGACGLQRTEQKQ